jgi:hypothetical protein
MSRVVVYDFCCQFQRKARLHQMLLLDADETTWMDGLYYPSDGTAVREDELA